MFFASLRGSVSFFVATLLSATVAYAQQNHGTPEQRAACAPDAFRLCGRYIPDPESVESCLRQQIRDLSDACRTVFEQSATQQIRSTPRLSYRRSAVSSPPN